MNRVARVAWKFPAVALSLALIALSLILFHRYRRRDQIIQYILKVICWILGFRITARLEPKPPQTKFIISNHLSYLDIFLIGSLFPTRFLAKEEVSTWFFVGWLARLGDTVFVKRDSMSSRFRALKELASKGERSCYTIFPEGTTSVDVSPNAKLWHRGHAYLGHHASEGLYGLGIHYEEQEKRAWIDDQSLLPHLIQVLMSKHIRVDVQGQLIMGLNTQKLALFSRVTHRVITNLSAAAAEAGTLSVSSETKTRGFAQRSVVPFNRCSSD